MSRQTIIIIAVVFFLLVLGIVGIYYLQTNKTTTPGTSGSRFDFFPFGQGPNIFSSDTSSTQGSSTTEETSFSSVQKLRQLTSVPVAGFLPLKDSQEYQVLYMERATGHVYSVSVSSGEAKRISNTTIPKVQSALWLPGGSGAVLQYLDTDEESIVTFSGAIATGTTERELAGTFLPRNILSVTLSPGGTLAYVLENGEGGDVTTSQPNGAKKTLLFSSPLKEWLVSWPATSTIMLSSKPSGETPGFLYFINTTSKTLTSVLGNVPGLTAIANRSLSRVVFAESGYGGISLKNLNTKTKEIAALPLNTLPLEKCAWSTLSDTVLFCAVPAEIPEGTYPDLWYQGSVSFVDNLWKIELDSGNSTLLGILSDQSNTTIDVVDPSISPDDRYVFFKNKNDGTLWSLELGSE
ncbi:hypothetical protein A3D66_03115 [Candidatus Kaiserbacteria bacterium RIFCSPHIGHO2_02_FULL_50_9]|uniref:Dipeptidylpeptidase IV N-terminal domain-containing protein n=1 Tax=Candidatus Kaiserbacteria bacterium RIFCSPLOWO2_01_FULL_51_21 TaxID=1798508 RepID=A0A1F6EDH2_9BACT|nr:MAG: hypothetical protein A2761_02555 [Candidatus Kaiserbacteria bacterium RIFCSPHIGHO2_01_FULL_51_33]OGG63665.1 MAG: hypothetical protein A3D66_03115 [Candidatus Kaiserbacteria bacterium RIFCSPHIGHO2_02_FULL_50_9]OGG71660.1 MAG: hypothetical protein A3A35_00645 [Candidatus Kaiserbacteria bacterium RIFCSPLOWO2_01_FULL_51_21]